MRKIFDIHMHFPRDWDHPERDPTPLVENLYEKAKEAGITRANFLCGGRFGISHEDSMKHAQRHPDLFIPTAMVDPETITRKRLRELRDMGYRGLKMIGVRRDYDTEDYFPVYEAAQEYGWPILFHCGVIGGGIDYSITHPRRDPDAARMYRRWAQFAVARNMSATRMRPFHLDTIANNFPHLRLIGAHLGGTGNYDEAASVARWRSNVYFDFSGGTTIERHAVERRLIGHEIGCEKLIFGSDTAPEKIADHIRRWDTIFDLLDISDDERDRMWWANGAEVYGLQKAPWERGVKRPPAPVRIADRRPRSAPKPAPKRRAAGRKIGYREAAMSRTSALALAIFAAIFVALLHSPARAGAHDQAPPGPACDKDIDVSSRIDGLTFVAAQDNGICQSGDIDTYVQGGEVYAVQAGGTEAAYVITRIAPGGVPQFVVTKTWPQPNAYAADVATFRKGGRQYISLALEERNNSDACGVAIIDVTDAPDITPADTVAVVTGADWCSVHNNFIESIAGEGRYIYLTANEPKDMRVLDIGALPAVTEIGRYRHPEAAGNNFVHDITVIDHGGAIGRRVYVSYWEAGVMVLDAADITPGVIDAASANQPLNPDHSIDPTGFRAHHAFPDATGRYVFIQDEFIGFTTNPAVDGDEPIQMWDIANPAAPVFVDGIDLGSSLMPVVNPPHNMEIRYDLDLDGDGDIDQNRLHVGWYRAGAQAFDFDATGFTARPLYHQVQLESDDQGWDGAWAVRIVDVSGTLYLLQSDRRYGLIVDRYGCDDVEDDNVCDFQDNCPAAANAGQSNNDALANDSIYLHSHPGDYSSAVSDLPGDACDDDDDNDGIPDLDEINGYTVALTGGGWACFAGGTSVGEDAANTIVVPNAHLDPDVDRDGARDGAECALGSDPTNQLSTSGSGCVAGALAPCRVSVPERCPGVVSWAYAADDDEDRDGGVNEGCPAVDADADGLADAAEAAYGGSPADADSDDDSNGGASPPLRDGGEAIYLGTSAGAVDSDLDACADTIEALDIGGGTASDPDHRVSATDAGIIYAAANYNRTVGVHTSYNPVFDLNHDGRVSGSDAGIVYSVYAYNKRCSTFVP